MKIKNYLEAPLENLAHCHDGEGTLRHTELFNQSEFQSGLRFINYTILPPGTSIGLHQHGSDEEVYIVLEGSGLMSLNDKTYTVESGSVIVNSPYGSHALENTGKTDLKLLVFEVGL